MEPIIQFILTAASIMAMVIMAGLIFAGLRHIWNGLSEFLDSNKKP
jgi:hypothetical protein